MPALKSAFSPSRRTHQGFSPRAAASLLRLDTSDVKFIKSKPDLPRSLQRRFVEALLWIYSSNSNGQIFLCAFFPNARGGKAAIEFRVLPTNHMRWEFRKAFASCC